MPIGAIVPALAGLAGTLFSSASSNKQARQSQDRANQQNIDFWKMQNAYNTPKQQMQRFQEAGLNPNLIYGQGNPGNAQQIAPAKASPTKDIDLLGGIGQFQNTMQSSAQTTALEKQAQNTATQTEKTKIENLLKMKELGVKDDLLKYQVDGMAENLRGSRIANNIKALDEYTTSQTQKDVINTAKYNAMEALQRSNKAAFDAQYSKFTSEMSKLGLTPNDDPFWRILFPMLKSPEQRAAIMGTVRAGKFTMENLSRYLGLKIFSSAGKSIQKGTIKKGAFGDWYNKNRN